ncbi:hypothetical protein NDU88_007177 [Pleurodeles waltl]|uniref:Uncharacterized protein n=1 Tax=Pleurodeles waltl TaxID=8319 RepID=A0AAV7NU75_PLEWA|nr:hypothetical protein NDU88_007177 [Pleurodeles waltl]
MVSDSACLQGDSPAERTRHLSSLAFAPAAPPSLHVPFTAEHRGLHGQACEARGATRCLLHPPGRRVEASLPEPNAACYPGETSPAQVYREVSRGRGQGRNTDDCMGEGARQSPAQVLP